MPVNKVELHVSKILEDLDNGLTWLKKDDAGYGSIQEKYNAKDQQIAVIRKHPKLKDAETSLTVFTVIDDTDERTTTVSTSKPVDAEILAVLPGQSSDNNRSNTENRIDQLGVGQPESSVPSTPNTADADAFFNL